MGKKDFDTEKLKDIIQEAMSENGGKIGIDDAVELLRPHFEYDPDRSYETALKNKTRAVINSITGDDGARSCYANTGGLYLNIEMVDDPGEMAKIMKQVIAKLKGIVEAYKKIRGKMKQLDGQTSMFDEELEAVGAIIEA